MNIEEAYKNWYNRCGELAFTRENTIPFNIDKHLNSSNVVYKSTVELFGINGNSFDITLSPNWYTFLRKIKQGKVKRVKRNNIIRNIKHIFKFNKNNTIVDYKGNKVCTNPNYIDNLIECDSIEDFCICFNGLFIHPYYLKTYNKEHGELDFTEYYIFEDLNKIIDYLDKSFRYNDFSIVDTFQFTDHYTPTGVYGYITLNSSDHKNLRIYFIIKNNGNIRISLLHYVADLSYLLKY